MKYVQKAEVSETPHWRFNLPFGPTSLWLFMGSVDKIVKTHLLCVDGSQVLKYEEFYTQIGSLMNLIRALRTPMSGPL